LGGISDALTGRSTWELSGNKLYRLQWEKVEKWERKWQRYARLAAVAAWKQQIEREQKASGSSSYYRERMRETERYEKCFCQEDFDAVLAPEVQDVFREG
jgi:hypothetical protein